MKWKNRVWPSTVRRQVQEGIVMMKKKLALRLHAKAVRCRAACRHTSESICLWKKAEVAIKGRNVYVEKKKCGLITSH